MINSVFIYSEDLLHYKFNQHHPFSPIRLQLTYDLLKALDILNDSEIVTPRSASDEELMMVHEESYIEAVKTAGEGASPSSFLEKYGLGTEDNPVFANMHEAASMLVGATLTAVDLVMTGESKHALSLGGGLHHGFRGKASGFCIYNDCSVAIEYIRRKYNARVLYVDTDAHHGDGVQWAFYDDPDVCTLSIHETGRYLFPGTGNVNEKGHGHGYGYSINIPIDAFTEDESFLEVYEIAINEVADFFQPDVIITQNGADAHCLDPLTHLSVTMKVYDRIPKIAKEIANKHCSGKWIAVGGGGYDCWRVVPRAWASIWNAMKEYEPEEKLPTEWLQKWQSKAPNPLPTRWDDPDDLYPKIPRKREITEKNKLTLEKALYHIRNK